MQAETNSPYLNSRTPAIDVSMSSYEWDRAQENMRQAMYLGDLTLAGVQRVRSALAPMALAMRRGMALIRNPVAHRVHD